MRKLYILCLLFAISSTIYAQDTLKHYDLWEQTESPLDQATFPSPWGYSYGYGAPGHYEFAEKYYLAEEKEVLGIVVYFDDIMGSVSSDLEDWVAIYSKDGNKPKPAGTPTAKQTVVAKNLTLGLSNPSIVLFENRPTVKDTFFAAFGMPQYEQNQSSPKWVDLDDELGIMLTTNRNEDPDSNVFFRNAVRYPNPNGPGIWRDPTGIAKGDKKRNFLISPIVNNLQIGVEETTLLQNEAITVKSVYPNPVIEDATLNIELSQESNVVVNVLNMSGQQLSSKDFGSLSTGNHNLTFETSDLEAGQYIYLVKTDYGMIASVLQKQ
ncbi:MAG: T9SS type A sorting domain-containing protein [Bacteroidetes bacterium]|nr:T9SS type A sorting domain-containing protein [Bacteroidota bacterium]